VILDVKFLDPTPIYLKQEHEQMNLKLSRLIASAIIGSVVSAVIPSPAFAQRYLTEFVGLSHIQASVGTVPVESQMIFDVQSNRRVDGVFAYFENSLLGGPSEVEAFSASGTLAASGSCNVSLSAANNKGSLTLFEGPGDETSFSLFGSMKVNHDAGDVKLVDGKVDGRVALLLPAADSLSINQQEALAILTSDVDNSVVKLPISLAGSAAGGVSLIQLGIVGDPSSFLLTVSASDKLLYAVGASETNFLWLKVGISVDSSSGVTPTLGRYTILDDSRKIVDTGEIAVISD
jgi:hypothetical protein